MPTWDGFKIQSPLGCYFCFSFSILFFVCINVSGFVCINAGGLVGFLIFSGVKFKQYMDYLFPIMLIFRGPFVLLVFWDRVWLYHRLVLDSLCKLCSLKLITVPWPQPTCYCNYRHSPLHLTFPLFLEICLEIKELSKCGSYCEIGIKGWGS